MSTSLLNKWYISQFQNYFKDSGNRKKIISTIVWISLAVLAYLKQVPNSRGHPNPYVNFSIIYFAIASIFFAIAWGIQKYINKEKNLMSYFSSQDFDTYYFNLKIKLFSILTILTFCIIPFFLNRFISYQIWIPSTILGSLSGLMIHRFIEKKSKNNFKENKKNKIYSSWSFDSHFQIILEIKRNILYMMRIKSELIFQWAFLNLSGYLCYSYLVKNKTLLSHFILFTLSLFITANLFASNDKIRDPWNDIQKDSLQAKYKVIAPILIFIAISLILLIINNILSYFIWPRLPNLWQPIYYSYLLVLIYQIFVLFLKEATSYSSVKIFIHFIAIGFIYSIKPTLLVILLPYYVPMFKKVIKNAYRPH